MSEKKFPIIGTGEYIDWNLIEPHRDQAKHNHGQSLEQLADRGGLFWNELLWVLLDKGLWEIKLNSDEDYEKACRRALAHEELKQYRETGTPEECRAAMEKQTETLTVDKAKTIAAKAICAGCGYLTGYECSYKGGNCMTSKPMLESVYKYFDDWNRRMNDCLDRILGELPEKGEASKRGNPAG